MLDWELLQQFREHGSNEAFAELVRRHVDMVYRCAQRRVRDAHLAEDVTQAVFILLAKRASTLKRSVVIAGWLHQAARLSASSALRGERRRKLHEKAAAEVMQMNSSDAELPLWEQIEPGLDRAIDQLARRDREVIAVRFLEGLSVAEAGTALGISESAVKMRVSRAVARLRRILVSPGLEFTAPLLVSALESGLSKNQAPTSVVHAAMAAASGASHGSSLAIAKGANAMLRWMKIKVALVGMCCVGFGTATIVIAQAQLAQPQAPPQASAPAPAALLVAASDAKTVDAIHVSVTFRQIQLEGKPADWAAVQRQIDLIPVDQRKQTRLELSAVSGDVPVGAFFEAQNRAQDIVKKSGLAYLSLTGIQAVPGDAQVKGEYYIGGDVPRKGVYSVDGRKVNLKQALIAAGIEEAAMDDTVNVIRRTGPDMESFVRDLSISALFDGSKPDIYLMPYDQVMVVKHK